MTNGTPNMKNLTTRLARLRVSVTLHVTRITLVTLTITCGCQVLTYTGPNGERFKRLSVATTTSLTSVTVETGSNGLRRVEVHGYRHDLSQTLATVAESAARGAVQGAK